jgi:hypothetical protein|tara:strand:- start:1836 stop:2087 length:252 start_codon:yes stop_codon:yes gene_type:complete
MNTNEPIDSYDFWLEEVLNQCQNTLSSLQDKYGVGEIQLSEVRPEDLTAINVATGFINLYRLAAANQLITTPQELSGNPIVIH